MNKKQLASAHRDAIRGPPTAAQNKTAAWRLRRTDRGDRERPRSPPAPDTATISTNGNCTLG